MDSASTIPIENDVSFHGAQILNSLGGKLLNYQREGALEILGHENNTDFLDSSSGIISKKFGILKGLRSFGKKRTLAAACIASFADNLNTRQQIKKAISPTLVCGGNPHQNGIYNTEDFVRTTLIVCSPTQCLNWRTELTELGAKYFVVSGKDDFGTFVRKNKGNIPVFLLCSVNIYRKFIERPANRQLIWRRAIFSCPELPIFNNEISTALKASFFWATSNNEGRFNLRKHNTDIEKKAITLGNSIVSSRDEEIFLCSLFDIRTDRISCETENSKPEVTLFQSQLVPFLKESGKLSESRLTSAEEEFSAKFTEECVICNEESDNKLLMLCCLQVVCKECNKKHINSKHESCHSFSCIFCRSKTDCSKDTVSLITNDSVEIQENVTLVDVIKNICSGKKTLIIELNQFETANLNENFPGAITFDNLRTFPKIMKTEKMLSEKNEYVIILNIVDFMRLSTHRVLSGVTEIVNLTSYQGIPHFVANPSRNPYCTYTIHNLVKN
jgi:hypothetical protein